MKSLLLGATICLCATAAMAQTQPPLVQLPSGTAGVYGRPMTSTDLKGFFGGKADTLNGVLTTPTITAPGVTGGTFATPTLNAPTSTGGNFSNATVANGAISGSTFDSGTITNTLVPGYIKLVSGNSALQALATTYATVRRLGYYNSGDGGAMEYNYSSASCTLNGGAGDNGSQVRPASGTGCWLANMGPASVSVKIWGAIGDGSSHPLSGFYGTLAAAQAFCPAATSLNNEIDWCAAKGAQAYGAAVYFPAGTYLWSDVVTTANGQCFYGDNRVASVVRANSSNFNMSASGVIAFPTSTTQGGCVHDLGINFVQPDITLRSAAVHYPPAIYAQNSPRAKISDVQVSGAWDGIDMRGNSGGSYLTNIEMGALNKGLQVLGSLDFVHVEHWHAWPFGMGATTIPNVYEDGNTVAATIGGTTSFIADGWNIFSGRTQLVPDAGVTNYAVFSNLNLDTGSTVEVTDAVSHVVVNGGYYTGSAATAIPSFAISAGFLTVAGIDFYAGTSAPLISVTGGDAKFVGGRMFDNNPANQAAIVSGGALSIVGTKLSPGGTTNHTVPFIQQTGGSLHLVDTDWGDTGSITATAISVATDNTDNDIHGNNFKNWFYSYPTAAYLGRYGSNNVLTALSWTPTVGFLTSNGTFNASYAAQSGKYWYTPTGIDYQIDVTFSSASYSGTTGPLVITMPTFAATQSTYPETMQNVTSWGGLNLTAGYTQLGALYVQNGAAPVIELAMGGSGAARAFCAAACVPASVGVELHITGHVNQ